MWSFGLIFGLALLSSLLSAMDEVFIVLYTLYPLHIPSPPHKCNRRSSTRSLTHPPHPLQYGRYKAQIIQEKMIRMAEENAAQRA